MSRINCAAPLTPPSAFKITRDPNWAKYKTKLREASELVFLAEPPLYHLFSLDHDSIVTNLEEQFLDSKSELGRCVLIETGDEITGIICYYPVSEMKSRQQRSTRMLLTMERCHSDALERLTRHVAESHFHIYSGIHLARIAVAPGHRGKGLGTILLQEFESLARHLNAKTVGLNVRQDNKVALSLYYRHQYRLVSPVHYAYLTLIKSL